MFSLCGFGQINDLTRAVKEGNVQFLGDRMSSTVEVSAPGFNGHYGQRQAKEIISGFFQNNKPLDFTPKSVSESGGSQHFMGRLKTHNGNCYRVFMQVQKDAEHHKEQLRVIRFESER